MNFNDRMEADRLVAWCFHEADQVLDLHDLTVDEEGRLKLAKAVSAVVQRASLVLERRARGEVDDLLDEMPSADAQANTSTGKPKQPVRLSALFDGWAAERRPAAKTLYRWRRVIAELENYLGHDDATRLTPDHLIAWKGEFIAQGRRPKTIRDSKLAPVRAVLQWGVDNRRLSTNPAERITIDIKLRAGEGRRSFTDEEAKLVLAASEGQVDPVRRWVPWLCAYTGARVSEICQLRADDVREVEGIWSLRIDPEAGPLKNRSSERSIPLHDALIAAGLLTYVEGVGEGPLFPSLPLDKFGKRGGNGTKILGRWVRSLGLNDSRLSPSHS